MHVREFLTLQEVEQTDGRSAAGSDWLNYDSRKAVAGTVFFCCTEKDGHDYIGEASKRGAAAVVVSRVGLVAIAGDGARQER
jgi:UDP-N-acetylmuramyl pentapeptide synthase